MTYSLVSIGECMVEMARGGDGRFGLAYGGDTFNTAVYASRMGVTTAYATALGDDPYSDAIVALANAERVDMALAPRRAGRMPGLYLIETNPQGERSFFYWRDRSPARELFDDMRDVEVLTRAMSRADMVYFSGITLSLYSTTDLTRLFGALSAARQAGAMIAFDGNFRPRGWGHDLNRARKTFARFLPLCDIALPTLDDEQALWGDAAADATIARIAAHGVGEIIVKKGADGAVVHTDGVTTLVATPERVAPIDTTAAGDSFNAGYIAARMQDVAPNEAARSGHRLAAIVIRHRGAIVPREATQALGPDSAAAAPDSPAAIAP